MEMIKRKLKSNDGVSILFGLFGFMVAAMISIVIVTAATSAVKRVADDKVVNQNRLTLESAAQVIRDQMTGVNTTKTTVTKTTSNDSTSYTSNGVFANEMKTAVQYVDTRDATYESSGKILSVEAQDFDTVDVSFVMQTADEAASSGEYHLIFTFTLEGSSEEVYLTMNGNEQVDSTNSNSEIISWETVSINELGGNSEN